MNVVGGSVFGSVVSMRCGVLAVVAAAAALAAAAAAGDPPAVASAPVALDQLSARRSARRGQYPYMALVANMWGECSAAILAPIAVLGPASCLPKGYLETGRLEAGNSRFFTSQDFGDKPTQAKIIDKYIKLTPETPEADSLMIMKLLEPFEFTSFVQPIAIATERRSGPARALVVGYGMGGAEHARRQQTSLEVQLEECKPPTADQLCVAVAAGNDCRPDHGAALVSDRKLLAVAGTQSLCTGAAVLLVAPHSTWIAQQLRSLGDKDYVPGVVHRVCTSDKSHLRSAGSCSWGHRLLMVCSAAALLAWR